MRYRYFSKLEDATLPFGLKIEREQYATGGIIIDSDSDYGWKNLLGCDITATRFGYTLRMTSPMYLKSDPITEAYNVLREADEDTAIDAVTEAMNCLSEALQKLLFQEFNMKDIEAGNRIIIECIESIE